MKLKDMFHTGIEAGIAVDPRGKAGVQKFLDSIEKKRTKQTDAEKLAFCDTSLWNPYADSRMQYGTGEEEINHIMVGIDIETEDLILADKLRASGTQIDAVLAHHPEGRGLAEIDRVMDVQIQILKDMGVPENKPDHMMRPHREKIYRSIHARNLFRIERAAELLKIPLFNIHNPADHLVAAWMKKEICNKEWESLSEILKALQTIEEYAYYCKKGNPPILANGSGSNRTGKVVLYGFNGGTSGPKEYIEEMSYAGVGTFLSMHIDEESKKIAAANNINVIQVSHMAADTLGMNLLLDILCKKEPKLHVLEMSGFVRVSRN